MERMASLSDATWAALEAIARHEDVSVGQLAHDAVRRDLYRRSGAKKADQPDERLIAPLRVLLAEDPAFAAGWTDLAQRLAQKGFRIAESGPGLVLMRLSDGARLCKASDLGYSHARLTRRLGSAFPGHADARILARA